MKLIDQISSPGSKLGGGMKTGAGDDRFAFDEGGEWACVIDGATDVGPVRLYPDAESDAAHFAEVFAGAVMRDPPKTSEAMGVYLPRLTRALGEAAAKGARVKLDIAPKASLPTAAATLVRKAGGRIEGATLGDSIAIVRAPDGVVSVLGEASKPAEEQGRARRVMAMTPEERLKWLQDVRAIHNTERGYWVFGVQGEAAGHAVVQNAACPPGTRVLVMTDGFYRLVSPYGVYDDAGLIEAAGRKGLGGLMSELRALEASPADDAKIGRFKTSDDATALLLEF